MTKADLVDRVAGNLQLTREEGNLVVTAALECIVVSLRRGERVEIRGFGSFTVRVRPPRIRRNPRTGEPVSVGETVVPFFKPSSQLRRQVAAAWTSSS